MTENEAYNTLVCSEFAPELGRDNVHQLGDETGDETGDGAGLPPALRGRAIFRSGLGVEDLARHDRDGWTFGSLSVSEPAGYQGSAAGLPDAGGLLLLLRRNGTLRFFTHASRPTPAPGDVVLAYAPPGVLSAAGWQVPEPDRAIPAPSEDHVP